MLCSACALSHLEQIHTVSNHLYLINVSAVEIVVINVVGAHYYVAIAESTNSLNKSRIVSIEKRECFSHG